MKLAIEGWRFVPHSFAIVNQHQLLELRRRSHVQLFHREAPYPNPDWTPKPGLFAPEQEAQLRQIPPPPPGFYADATLRLTMPYNLRSGRSDRTYVFGTTEWRIVQKLMTRSMGVRDFGEAHRNSEAVLITPSNWSRSGFLRAGAEPERVVVVPHGVDPQVFSPLPEAERRRLRRQWHIDDTFIFLHVGIMTWNKGLRLLVKAFAAVTERYPQARLVLKGTDSIRNSRRFVVNTLNEMLSPTEYDRVLPRLCYIGKNLPAPELAQLYQTCDAYISPYLAEGFNMPVLEAIACGLPVLCTKGGPTDDFTDASFTRYIDSTLAQVEVDREIRDYLHPDLDHTIALMSDLIERPAFCQQAGRIAPDWVRSRLTWSHVVDRLLAVMAGSSPAELGRTGD